MVNRNLKNIVKLSKYLRKLLYDDGDQQGILDLDPVGGGQPYSENNLLN